MNQVASRVLPATIAGTVNPDLLRDERLHEIFVDTANCLPDKTALRCGDAFVTYAELHRLTDRWSAALRARAIGPGCIVGLWLDRSIAQHAAVLAVLKAGATYLPFDAHAPADRVITCLDDCGAALLLVDAAHSTRAASLTLPTLDVAAFDEAGWADSAGATLPAARAPRPAASDAAYIIYTSGSTGRPKGVAVSHASICHLVRAENEVLGVVQADVVYQGFSAAFDMALEEVFISYLVGASVFVATAGQVQSIDRLPSLLDQAGVTVLHCVPTLLAMMDGAMPSVRLINVGGEACPESLVDRWWHPRRRMVNTYGPTEATVTATAAELLPGEPVTIGVPLPNYTAFILDEAGEPALDGADGELCIGGPGVSLGYVNRPALNERQFVSVPGEQSAEFPLMYRTGDKARLDRLGRIVLQGRLDNQVKHRGFRIELGEVEAELLRLPGVRMAAAVLRGEGAAEHLAGFLVPHDGAALDPRTLRAGLLERLPCYMAPAMFHVLDDLPRLASGKIDRKSLPAAPAPAAPAPAASTAPAARGPCEPVLAAMQALFPHLDPQPGDDFFRDLGGHSLLAAVLASQLRKQDRFARLSLQDLYELRTATRLAGRYPAGPQAAAHDAAARQPFHPSTRLRHTLCSVAQAVALIPLLGLASLEFLAPYLAFDHVHDRFGMLPGSAAALAAFVAIPPFLMLAAIAGKWLMLGRVQEGRHPLWGAMFFRWWFTGRLIGLVNVSLLADTPLMAGFYRLLGARIGQGAHLGAVDAGAHDLVEIGAGASLGSGVLLGTARVEGGWLVFGRVRIGADAYIGSGCVLEAGSGVGARGELANLSMLPANVQAPAAEVWAGSPAVRRGRALPAEPAAPRTRARSAASIAGFAAVSALLQPLLHLLPMVPALVALEMLQSLGTSRSGLVLFAPLIGLGYTLLVLVEITVLRWLVLGRVREGVHGTASLFFLRKWTVDRLLELSLAVLHPIYASLYVVPFFRALGARVGRGAEISTAASVTHDLLEIGEGAFVADAVTLGDPEIRRGRLTLRRTVLGARAFIGNCAVLPDGVHIPDDSLVGCLSVPPEAPEHLAPGQACFGSPAILLPGRQSSTQYDPRLTYRPGPRQVAERLVIEGVRIILPRAGVFAMVCLALDAFETLPERVGLGPAMLAVPVLYVLLFCVPSLLGSAALKWALIGRYRAGEHPMWSRPVWLTEAVTAVYEALPVPLLLRHLQGTPFLPAALRLFGARLGRRTWIATTDLTEFDLVQIGDEAEINQNAGPQTHLFEDRVMKVGPVVLGARSTMGAHSIALPGSRLQAGARLGSLSLVMKGETIPDGPRWAGSPARCAG